MKRKSFLVNSVIRHNRGLGDRSFIWNIAYGGEWANSK